MITRCLSIEEIVALDGAGTRDPARAHVVACARCAAIAAEYAAFTRAQPVGGADVADADRRLAAFIAEQVERTPAGTGAGAARPERRRWFDLAPRRALMMSAAAAAVVLVGVTVMRNVLAPETMILRGTDAAAQLATYSVAGDASIPLLWAPVDGADAYRITILREDLTELRQIGPVAENSYVFAPAAHELTPGRYFWEVTALADGDSIGSLGPAPLFVR